MAEALERYKDRLIFGLSIGTLNDGICRAIEDGTSSITARLRVLHTLQDQGFRTFGMVCPSLPQTDYHAFARDVAQAIRVDKCEHVWAEVLNARGKSLTATVAALKKANFNTEASMLEEAVFDKFSWEAYARNTFLAHTKFIPAAKLRFMQYIQPGSLPWWKNQKHNGALLLGAVAGHTKNSKRSVSRQKTSASSSAHKAWQTMRSRYTAEELKKRYKDAAAKAAATRKLSGKAQGV